MELQEPIITVNEDGDLRRVGLELEFAGIGLPETAGIIQSLYGGELEEKHRYSFFLEGSRLGDFVVELDARLLKKMAGNNLLTTGDMMVDDEDVFKESITDVVDKLAKTVIPIEIVMPPVRWNQLLELEPLRKLLQEKKAEGTSTSFFNAFGLHMNIEVPVLDTKIVLRYFRAFLLVYPWLLQKLNIDFTRRMTPFIDPFPEKYVRRVLNPLYRPSSEEFTDDYLMANPTRNRPLDLLPILGLQFFEKVKPILKDGKNKPRPAFHYRLPNSQIDDKYWSFVAEWNHWLKVEKLAENPDLLHKLSRLYLLRERASLISFKKEWASTVAIFLDEES